MAGAGYKLFNTGDVLTAAQVNTYLQEQTVMVFASSTARTTALSGVLAEGMMSYLQDTNSVEVYNGTSWVNVGNAGDITEVQAGVGISIASGTGPIPVITNSSTDLITTAGDILYGTAADTMARLGIGTAGQVLKVNSGATAPEWGTASSGTPAFVGCVATRTSSSQSISAATYTVITLPSEELDTDGFHSTSTNTSRFTIPAGKAGKYMLNANLSLSQTPGSQSILAIAVNGTRPTTNGYDQGSFFTEKNGADQMQGASTIIVLAENDYVEVQIYAASACNIAFARMSLIYLGA